MAHREQAVGKSDDWYTPPRVFAALGCSFDIDVASPGQDITPWIPARTFIMADSLALRWSGFAWMNPPFGGRNGLIPWLDKFFEHANGIALVPDRTSAPWWQMFAPKAELLLFVAPKLKFIPGSKQALSAPAQGSCLMATGPQAVQALACAAAAGLGVLVKPLDLQPDEAELISAHGLDATLLRSDPPPRWPRAGNTPRWRRIFAGPAS